MEMAPKERVEPTISDLIQKSEGLEAAGAEPVVLDESEGARAYRESVDAIVNKARANMDKIEQEGLDNLAISARAIKPEEGTPYDSYGDPLDLKVAADMRLAQIALQDEEVSKKFMERLAKQFGPRDAATLTPLAMGNPSLLLTPENISDVQEIAPRYWTPEYQELFEHVGQTLLQDAGFSKDIIDRLDPDFVRYMGVTHKHEKAFPVEEPGIAERLKEPSAKTMILDALANKNVQRSMKWAGLVIGCVTGGIVVRAGMSGTKFLVGKLAENEKVQGFCTTLENRAISFVSTTMNIDEDKVRKNVNEAKGAAERLSNNKWVKLAGAAAVVGVAVAIGHIDIVRETAQAVATNFSDGFDLAVDKFLPDQAPNIASYPGVDPAAGAHNAATSGSFANATPPAIDSGSSYASYPGVDPAAGAQNAATHGSFTTTKAPVDIQTAQASPAPAIKVPHHTPTVFDILRDIPGDTGAHNAATHGSFAGAPANVAPPVLESGAAAPTAPINEHIDHAELDKIRAGAGQEFSAERSGLTNAQGTEVKFPTDSANMGVNSGAGPAAADATATVSAPVSHTVKSGDTLWDIAKQPGMSNQEIMNRVNQIYEANKDVIGNNPDRIFPGQLLKLDGLTHSLSHGVSHGVAAGVEVAASRETIPFAPDVLHDFVKDTKLDAVALDGVGKVAFPVPAPNFAHVGTEGVATSKDTNAALAEFYTGDAKKVAETVKVDKLDKFASLYDGHGKH